MEEIWVDINNVPMGYEGYKISNYGRVCSPTKLVDHRWGGKAIKKGMILSLLIPLEKMVVVIFLFL